MSEQTTLLDLLNVTSSQESADGRSPCNLPDGQKTDQCGQEVVPVNRSATQENSSGKPMSDTCGLCSSTSSASADLSRSLGSRLRARLEKVGSMEYRQTWKEQATPAGRPYLAHTASVRRTSDNDCTGWPTASSRDWKDTPGMSTTGVNPDGSTRTRLDQLPRVAQISGWPTPRANDAEKRGEVSDDPRNGIVTCANLAGWPSPTSNNGTGPGTSGREGGENLQTSAHGIRFTLPNAETGSSAGYRLNPFFSAWLMGFPGSWLTCIRNMDFRLLKSKDASRGGTSR